MAEDGVDPKPLKDTMTRDIAGEIPKLTGRRFIKTHVPFSLQPLGLLTKESKDLPQTIRKIADFLNVSMTDERVVQLVKHASVENMKNIQTLPTSLKFRKYASVDKEYVHVNEEKSGKWEKYFDEELAQSATKWLKEKYKTTDLRFPVDDNL